MTAACPKVALEAMIGTDGLIKDLKFVTGPEQLQQAAFDAVRKWRYRPYLLDGQPVAVRTTVDLIFNRLVNGPC
jgi:protein TonB